MSVAFLDISISLLYPTAPLISIHLSSYHLSLCDTRSPLPLPEWYFVHLYFAHPHHPTAFAARLCAPLRVPLSSAMSRVRYSPFYRSCPTPRSLSSPGGFDHRGYLHILCAPVLTSLSASSNTIIFRFLVSLSGGFLRRRSKFTRLNVFIKVVKTQVISNMSYH